MADHDTPTLVERVLGETEPVRRALYPMIVAAVALLVFYGRLSAESVPLWLALAVAVLGIGGTELARNGAYAPKTVAQIKAEQYGHGVADALSRTADQLAVGSRLQCPEVRDGARCALAREHEGGHLIPTD